MTRPVITLTTDFAEDFFTGVMRGVILGINPDARVVDLVHAIDPGDLRAGAFALLAGCRYFPKGSIHVAVVDPGVGSSRKILCAQTADYVFLAPDNGILSWALTREKDVTIHSVEERKFFLASVSSTFHGRDIFAPVAAHLSLGVKVADLGPEIAPDRIVRLEFPEPEPVEGGGLHGEILYVDRFGNCITNITVEHVEGFDAARVRVEIGPVHLQGLKRSYADGHPGTALALIGSAGFLEVATSGGNVAERFALHVGDPVVLTTASS